MSAWIAHLAVGSIGLALAALVAALLLAAFRREPQASYGVLRLVLVGALTLPILQLAVQRTWLPGSERLASWVGSLTERLERADEPRPPDVDSAPLPVEDTWLPTDEARFDPRELELLALALEDGSLTTADWAPSEPAVEPPPPREPARWPRHLLAAFAALYGLGVVLHLLRSALRLLRARRLVRGARPALERGVRTTWEGLRGSSALARRVRLLTSPDVRVPMCSGIGRPAILLPERGPFAPDAHVLRCVLLHELVHLERRDGWVMLAQELLRAPFWFHPGARWLSRRLDLFRELSCDTEVARRTGRPKRYAAALVEYAEWMQRELRTPHVASTALLPWTTSRGQLSKRIEMLLNGSSARPSGLRRLVTGGAFAFLPLVWGSQLALAACMSPRQGSNGKSADAPCCERAPDAVAAVAVPAPPASPGPASAPACAAAPSVCTVATPLPQETPLAPLPERHAAMAMRTPAPPAPPSYAYVPSDPAVAPRAYVVQQGGDEPLPVIGLNLAVPDAEDLEGLDVSPDEVLYVETIVPGSSAEQAGIEDGDVIVHVNGGPATFERLTDAKRHWQGGKIVLEISRDGDSKKIVLDGKDLKTPRTFVVPRGSSGSVLRMEPFQDAQKRSAEALARARDALRRAAESMPDNDELKEALEALEKVNAMPQMQGALTMPMPSRRMEMQGFDHEALRKQLEPMRDQIRAEVEEARRSAERASHEAQERASHEAHQRHAEERHADERHREQAPEGRDAELRELRKALEAKQRELQELRERLESLRAERESGSGR